MTHNKSITGLDGNILVLIVYVLCIVLGFIPGSCYIAWIFPLVFYFIEKNNQFLQLYMLEGAVLFALNAVVSGILNAVKWSFSLLYLNLLQDFYSFPHATFALSGVILAINSLCALIAVICVLKAWKYECFKIPGVYFIAQKIHLAISKIK